MGTFVAIRLSLLSFSVIIVFATMIKSYRKERRAICQRKKRQNQEEEGKRERS